MLLFKPQARRDTIDIVRYIAMDNPEAAEKFVTALENTTSALAEMPEMGRQYNFRDPRLRCVRCLRISRTFSAYLIFYQNIPEGIEVIRILHASRDFPSLFGEI